MSIAGDEEYEERIVTEQEIKLTNLHKFTNYTVIILAFTQKGLGARSDSIYCSTLEDGKFCMFLNRNVGYHRDIICANYFRGTYMYKINNAAIIVLQHSIEKYLPKFSERYTVHYQKSVQFRLRDLQISEFYRF